MRRPLFALPFISWAILRDRRRSARSPLVSLRGNRRPHGVAIVRRRHIDHPRWRRRAAPQLPSPMSMTMRISRVAAALAARWTVRPSHAPSRALRWNEHTRPVRRSERLRRTLQQLVLSYCVLLVTRRRGDVNVRHRCAPSRRTCTVSTMCT